MCGGIRVAFYIIIANCKPINIFGERGERILRCFSANDTECYEPRNE